MYKILERKQLADKIYYMVVNAPTVCSEFMFAGTVCNSKNG